MTMQISMTGAQRTSGLRLRWWKPTWSAIGSSIPIRVPYSIGLSAVPAGRTRPLRIASSTVVIGVRTGTEIRSTKTCLAKNWASPRTARKLPPTTSRHTSTWTRAMLGIASPASSSVPTQETIARMATSAGLTSSRLIGRDIAMT